MILRYKLRDFIKIYDAYANDPIKEDFQKTLLLFHIGIYFIYLFKILKLYIVAHPIRGVLRLKEYMYTKFIYKNYQGIKEI